MKESAARVRILDVASRLFYEQGYNSTGINQIIIEAEIARGSLYKHFPSKKDLLIAYLQKAEELWFGELDKFLKPIKDPQNKLLGLFDYRIDRQLRSNFGGCQFSKISAEIPKDDLTTFALVVHQKDRLKTYIKNLLEQTSLRKPGMLSEQILADSLFLMMEGATLVTSISKDVYALKNAKKIAEKLISV